jgi:hypothetical protein
MALIVIFAIVIVFWMVFHQNGSTLTYWADDNTAWNVSGTISNSINPFWIVVLTFPLVWFWGWLDKRGKEPSTPTKMAIGMTAHRTFVFRALRRGENRRKPAGDARSNTRRVRSESTNASPTILKADGVPQDVLDKMLAAKDADGKNLINDVKFSAKEDETTKVKIAGEQNYIDTINTSRARQAGTQYREAFLQRSYLFQVSPFWLLLAYAIISLRRIDVVADGLVAGFKSRADSECAD